MGITKTDLYLEKHNKIAKTLKAIAHPARIAILEYLLKQNTCICGDLVKEFPIAQATISQHLKELKNEGFIKGNIEGNSVCYCIDKEKIEEVKLYFEVFLNQLKSGSTCC